MKLKGKKVVILVSNEFEDIEVFYPFLRLSEEGAWITFGIYQRGFHPRPAFPGKPITGRFGLTVPPMFHREGYRYDVKEATELSPDDYDAVIIPGGFSPDYLRREPKVTEFVRKMYEQGKIIAAICHGPWLIISAKIVKGKRIAGVTPIRDDIENAGAIFVDEPVVVDGNIITSRVPDDLPEFCQAIINAMS
ncbi:MAG: type 1 glutamine amidotransferase [bacterium]|nr:type 1 glutamine amidotransferase [bacterium]